MCRLCAEGPETRQHRAPRALRPSLPSCCKRVTRILCLYENSLKKTFANRQQSELHMFDTGSSSSMGHGACCMVHEANNKSQQCAKGAATADTCFLLHPPPPPRHKQQPNGAPSSLPHLLWQPEAMTTLQTFVFDFVTSLQNNNN